MLLKLLGWIGSAKTDLVQFPPVVIREVGHALYLAQLGDRHSSAKPLKGFGGATVLEVVESHDGNTYRAVYTVRFAEVVYVLHAFQKKSKHGIATPQHELEKIKTRLSRAEQEYLQWKNEQQIP
jgi:phage-related protein